MPFSVSRHTLLALAIVLAGCARSPVADDAATAPPAPTASAKQDAPKVVLRNYSPDMLGDLLVAEVAAQRNIYGVTLGYYSDVARTTEDATVAEQAARLAAYLKDPVLASEMGELWLDGDDSNRDARELLALSYIEQGETAKAAEQIDVLMADHPREALISLVSQARNLDEDGNARLLAALGSLTERYPDQAPLWYARALNLEMEQQHEQALTACDKAIRLDPAHEDSLLLKARLLYELDRADEGLAFLKKTVRKQPDAKRVRVLYTRLLLEAGERDEARKQLAELDERYPEDRDLRLSLALLALEHEDDPQARATLEALLDEGYRSDEIRLYLAHIAERAGRPQQAMDYYMAVQNDNQLRARVQAARLMYSQQLDAEAHAIMNDLRDQHPDQMPALYAAESDILTQSEQPQKAVQLLSDALRELPDNSELLYARAMAAEQADNLDQLEADLTRILELKPNDPSALNALGYTLVDRTARIDEAAGYIEAAYAARPNDPAIIDSLGWLRYRQGRLDEALALLQQAYEMFPDQEVAAHLGEVLWQLGQQEQAREIWRTGLEDAPDSKAIPETLLRLTGSDKP